MDIYRWYTMKPGLLWPNLETAEFFEESGLTSWKEDQTVKSLDTKHDGLYLALSNAPEWIIMRSLHRL